jgi:hypothetical protein
MNAFMLAHLFTLISHLKINEHALFLNQHSNSYTSQQMLPVLSFYLNKVVSCVQKYCAYNFKWLVFLGFVFAFFLFIDLGIFVVGEA